jgi:flagellar hook-length control protein FliK
LHPFITMPNASISTLLTSTPPAQPAAPRNARGADEPQRDDPATAFNRVMERNAARAERKPAAAPNRAAQDASGAPKPAAQMRTNTPEAAEKSGDAAEDAAGAEPAARSTATGDLFAAEIGMALAIARPVEAQLEAGIDPALAAALPGAQPTNEATSATIAATTDAEARVGLPAHHGATVIDGDASAPVRNMPRAPRLAEAPGSASAKFGAEAQLADHALHERSTAEADKLPASALEFRTALPARSEALNAPPLSLSAALAAGAPPAWSAGQNLAPTYSIAHAQVAAPVGSPLFAEDFSQRIVVLAGQRVQSAQIALTPSDLGPISVSMEVRGQDASLLFGAAQATTRAAIEDALPRLREMFQAQGLHLVDAHVGMQLGHQAPRDGSGGTGTARQGRAAFTERAAIDGVAGDGKAADAAAGRSLVARSDRLVDVRV